MVHHHIHDNADPLAVGRIHKGPELFYRSHVTIHHGPVQGIITMETVVGKISPLSSTDIAVNLLIRGGDPDGIDPQILKVPFLQLLCESFDVPAVEGADALSQFIGILSAVRIIVLFISIQEPVRHGEIHRGIFVGEGSFAGSSIDGLVFLAGEKPYG